jgi:hypothetical protein
MQTLISTTKTNDYLWTVDYVNESVGKCLFSGSEEDCDRFYDNLLLFISNMNEDTMKQISLLKSWSDAK